MPEHIRYTTHHMAFFFAGKLKTGPHLIHKPHFSVKNGSRPVHVQFWQFSGSCQLDDPIFHVYQTWISFTGLQRQKEVATGTLTYP
jgi:hypothetical protein